MKALGGALNLSVIVKPQYSQKFVSSSIYHRNMKSLYDWVSQLCLSRHACTSELVSYGGPGVVTGDDGGNFGVKSCKNIWKGRPEPHSGAARPSNTITQPQLIGTDRLHNRRPFENFSLFLLYLWRFREEVLEFQCVFHILKITYFYYFQKYFQHITKSVRCCSRSS